MKISHCSECGDSFADTMSWPRCCATCGTRHWRNPKPVVMVMQPVIVSDGNVGLIVGKRAIQPAMGEWAIIAGFMEIEENAEEAAAREFREETGIDLAGPAKLLFSRSVGGPVRDQLMVVTYVEKALDYDSFRRAQPCPENEEIDLFFQHDTRVLAFPVHREAAKNFFAGEYPWHP